MRLQLGGNYFAGIVLLTIAIPASENAILLNTFFCRVVTCDRVIALGAVRRVRVCDKKNRQLLPPEKKEKINAKKISVPHKNPLTT